MVPQQEGTGAVYLLGKHTPGKRNTEYFQGEMKMEVRILNECGYDEAMLGLSLSYNKRREDMPRVAERLSVKDGGHNKFLESIAVWLDIKAPRYWWQEFDTYRVGMTKQSESTMHTILRRRLTADDFEGKLPSEVLAMLNHLIESKDFDGIKRLLPESFLQRRVVCTNYRTLRNMILQRESHRLQEWQTFISGVLAQVERPELLRKGK
jgi:hypothetical protein